MRPSIDEIKKDLGLFADLGTGGVAAKETPDGFVLRLVRNAEIVQLVFPKKIEKPILEFSGTNGAKLEHDSYRSLLASERFGNLTHWANVQGTFLRGRKQEQDDALTRYMDVSGVLDEGTANHRILGANELHGHFVDLAGKAHDENEVQILLINGSAGIGKTIAIQRLALERALNYNEEKTSLVLHVESRGRLLTFIEDLMAYSLQRLQLSVTFNQVPVLIRNGLVLLAIDGFDELGDPSGYDLAWAQVNELLNDVRGYGQVLLAGRETFIGKERIFKDIRGLNKNKDVVQTLTLEPPSPNNAVQWLKNNGWSDENIESCKDLFELGAYSLRPFFLRRLIEPDFAESFQQTTSDSQLETLIDLMIEREITKFGEPVEKQWPEKETRKRFIKEYMREVARELAESQSDAISEETLELLVEHVAQVIDEKISTDVVKILVNRAKAIAFLINDDRPTFRRFIHSQIMYHFLAHDAINVVANKELPKYIRRGILASDFLAVFSDVISSRIELGDNTPEKFRDVCIETLEKYSGADRVTRNLAALLLCFLSTKLGSNIKIKAPEVNEALLAESSEPAEVNVEWIYHLDIRDADVSQIDFSGSKIINLVVNRNSRVPSNLPTPASIEDTTMGAQPGSLYEPGKINDWIVAHSPRRRGADADVVRDHDIFKLLDRACRYRNYWIRQESDHEPFARRIIENPLWQDLLKMLNRHELLTEKEVPASENASIFFHIRRRMEILLKLRGDRQDSDILMVSDDDGNIDALIRDLDKFAANNP